MCVVQHMRSARLGSGCFPCEVREREVRRQTRGPGEIERQRQRTVYEGSAIIEIQYVSDSRLNLSVQKSLPYLNRVLKADVSGTIKFGDLPRFFDGSGIKIGCSETHRIGCEVDRPSEGRRMR